MFCNLWIVKNLLRIKLLSNLDILYKRKMGDSELHQMSMSKGDIKYFSQSLSILVFETRALSEPGVHQFS